MDQSSKLDFDKLRKKAEEILKRNPDESVLELSEADQIKLIHELEVYKVELELQQEELRGSKERIDNLNKKYEELMDLHNRIILHLIRSGKSPEGGGGSA